MCDMTFIQHAGISQGFEYLNSDLHVLKGTTFATFYALLVKIGPLFLEITHFRDFGTRRQNTTYTKYLRKYWTELHQLFSIGSIMYTDYKTEIILQ